MSEAGKPRPSGRGGVTHLTKYRLRTLAQDAFMSWLLRRTDEELIELLRGHQPVKPHRRMNLSKGMAPGELEKILEEDADPSKLKVIPPVQGEEAK